MLRFAADENFNGDTSVDCFAGTRTSTLSVFRTPASRARMILPSWNGRQARGES